MNDNSDLLSRLLERRRAFERSLTAPQVQASLRTAESHLCATCPCCGYPTLSKRNCYWICLICNWEDDGQDDREFAPRAGYFQPDEVAGGPNADYSLTEARLNFERHGQMYRPSDSTRFGRMAHDHDLRQAMRSIFDQLLPSVTPDSYLAAISKLTTLSNGIREARIRIDQTQHFFKPGEEET